jgi:hypothetical protein
MLLNAVVKNHRRKLPLHDHAFLETALVIAYDVLFWNE